MPVSTLAVPEPATSRRALEPVASMAVDSALGALDPGAERSEALLDPLVAADDLSDVPDRRFALRAQTRDQQRPSRPDVRALHPLAVQARRPRDDRAVRVAEDDPRPHVHELVHEEQPALEHLLEDQDDAPGLGRHRQGDRCEVGGKQGPWPVLDLRDLPTEIVLHDELLPGRHADTPPRGLDLHAKLSKGGKDGIEVVDARLVDRELTAGDRRQTDEARHLDVVGGDPPLASRQAIDPGDAKAIRTDALDPRTEPTQKAAEILHVRFAGGVVE